MSTITPDTFAAWLTEHGYADNTVRRARGVAARFLADFPETSMLTPETIGKWLARRAGSDAALSRQRRELTRLRECALDVLPADEAAQLIRARDELTATLDQFAAWLTDRGMAAVTVKHARNIARAFITDHPAWQEVSDNDVTDWVNGRTGNRSTRSAYRGAIRSLYRWAATRGDDTTARVPRLGGPGTGARRNGVKIGRHMADVPAVWDRYLEGWVNWLAAGNRSEQSIYLREYQVRRFASENPLLYPMRVTVDDLSAWMAGQLWGHTTRHSFRAGLCSFYGWAHKSGHIDRDPAAILPKVMQPRSVARPAPDPVIRGALERADGPTGMMIRLGAFLGLRRGEISRVHADDLSIDDAGRATLRVTGKGGHERRLPVAGDLADDLRRFVQDNPGAYLFPGDDDGHLTPHHVGKCLSRALGPGCTGHQLRHRFATAAYAPSRDMFTVQTLLGHSSPVTTRGYVQLPDDALRDAVAGAELR
ncbi:tyrosine-type recombinase/integrase [Flexivirga sp.]|uniref:tyrosine-type recombinase/integrase n=1 Tax=Flexivirga sp. TaxID=1962927 RepID=UPI003F7E6699